MSGLACMQNALPDVLCVVQVALEGAVSKKAALNSLAQGNLPQVTAQQHRRVVTRKTSSSK